MAMEGTDGIDMHPIGSHSCSFWHEAGANPSFDLLRHGTIVNNGDCHDRFVAFLTAFYLISFELISFRFGCIHDIAVESIARTNEFVGIQESNRAHA
jgi:hypothetical protein